MKTDERRKDKIQAVEWKKIDPFCSVVCFPSLMGPPS